jgi:hypothetical protein
MHNLKPPAVLTDEFIEALKYTETPIASSNGQLRYPRQYVRDDSCTGLSVMLYPSGTKSFELLTPGIGGSHVILGRANGPKAITLEQARQMAHDRRAQYKAGKNPFKERKDQARTQWQEWQAPERHHVEASPLPKSTELIGTGLTFGQGLESLIGDRKLKAGTVRRT